MHECTADFIHAAKTAPQVVYETALKKVEKDLPLIFDEASGQYLKEDGTPFEDEVFQNPDGSFFGKGFEDEADEESQRIYLKSVPFDEVLHTPTAKSPCEIKEMAYYFSFTKEEAKEAGFSEDILANYPWKKQKSKETNGEPAIESPDEYMDGWECWCKHTKKVYWVSEGYPMDFLKEPKDDPYGIDGFFPSPQFAIQNKPRKSLYPTPPYIHLGPTIQQLNKLYEREFNLIDGIRRRALVNGDEDLVNALNAGDLEFISAQNVQSIVDKGGSLENLIYWVPVQELVQSISETNAVEDRFKANFDEWFGTPDILQGQSDPIESLGAQEIKATSASDRFKNNKKKLQRLGRDSLEMMIDLSLKVFSDEKIKKIVGFDFLEEDHQARFDDALQMLRDDETRLIRIDIETDSMTFVDKGLKQQRLNAAIQTAINGLKEIGGMQDPTMASVALQTVLMSLNEMDVGKKFQDHVKKAGEKLLQQMTEPKEPPPDVNMLRLDVEKQKIASADNKAQLDAQVKMRDLDRKEQELFMKQQSEEVKNSLLQFKEEVGANLNERIQAFIEMIESEKLEIERLKVGLDEKEKFLEEERLKNQQEIETLRTAIHAYTATKKEEPSIQIG